MARDFAGFPTGFAETGQAARYDLPPDSFRNLSPWKGKITSMPSVKVRCQPPSEPLLVEALFCFYARFVLRAGICPAINGGDLGWSVNEEKESAVGFSTVIVKRLGLPAIVNDGKRALPEVF